MRWISSKTLALMPLQINHLIFGFFFHKKGARKRNFILFIFIIFFEQCTKVFLEAIESAQS